VNQFSVINSGACTAIGLSAPATAAAVSGEVAGFAEHPYLVDEVGERMVLAVVPFISELAVGASRLTELAVAAAREAALPLEGSIGREGGIPLVLAIPPARPGLADGVGEIILGDLVVALKDLCKLSQVNYLQGGHATGIAALEMCLQTMRATGARFGLIGGVDSYIIPETLEWLESEEQLHSGRNPWGFIPGEAAAFCLLTAFASSGGASPRLDCLSLATSRESALMKTEAVCTGEGLTVAIRKAIEVMSPEERVSHVFCDMNGEPFRADEYGFAITRLSNRFASATDFVAPADCWGDVGAATGPLLISLAHTCAKKRDVAGEHTLVWTSSEDGLRSAALFLPNPGRKEMVCL